MKNEFCKQAIAHYGVSNQVHKAIEECGELIAALSRRLSRPASEEEHTEQVIEELADVQIMIWQMGTLYGEDNIARMITTKLARLQERMSGSDV